MSLFSDIVARGEGRDIKKEDEAVVYFKPLKKFITLKNGEYKEHEYSILTTGKCPAVRVYGDNKKAGAHFGSAIVEMPDRNGQMKKLDREVYANTICFTKIYADKDDYQYGKKTGKKYTLEDLKSDTEAYIDEIVRIEDDYIKFSMKDKN